MIPKIIHYCWLGPDSMPKDILRWMKTWLKVNPGFELMLWDKNNSDIEALPWTSEAFSAKKWAFVSDYIRLKALYEYGGIYLDCDVECVRPFGELLELDYFLGIEQEKRPRVIEAAVMGCIPKMPWVKDCLDYYDSRHFILEDGSYDMKALPFIISTILEEKFPQMLDTLLPCDWFNANELERNNETRNTITIHHFKNSWAEERCAKEREYQRFFQTFLPRKIAYKVALFWGNVKYEGIRKAFSKLKIFKKS